MAKEHILVVDDKEEILELVTCNLAREGYHVTGALTGENTLKKSERKPLILLYSI